MYLHTYAKICYTIAIFMRNKAMKTTKHIVILAGGIVLALVLGLLTEAMASGL